MFKTACLLALAAGIGLSARAASAQVAPATPASEERGPAPQVATQVVPTMLGGLTSGLRVQVQVLRAEHEAVTAARDRIKQRYTVGQAPVAEVEQAEARLQVTEIMLREAEAKLVKELRLSVLERPLNLRLADANLRQAAVALTEVSGMPVFLADGIPLDKRLSLDAKGVTFGLLLETLAQKTDLMIAPDPRGFLIMPWPTLEVDGHRVVRRGSTAPWSDEWTGFLFFGDRATAGMPFASGGGVLFSRGGPNDFATQVPGLEGAPDAVGNPQLAPPGGGPRGEYRQLQPNLSYMLGAGPTAGPIHLAPLGDRNVVIAEPGIGEKGESGYWLTVYRFDGDRLRKLSAIFHPATSQGIYSRLGVPGYVTPSPVPNTPRLYAPPRSVRPSLPKGPLAPSTKPAPRPPVQPGAPDGELPAPGSPGR